MARQNGAFVLTQRHLEEGLTGEDMSTYVGIPVAVTAHDDFPHSAELRENEYLPDDKLDERSAAVSRYLERIKLPDLLPDARLLAGMLSSCYYGLSDYIELSRLQVEGGQGWNPYEVDSRYLFPAKQGEANACDRWVVAPKPLGRSLERGFLLPMLKSEAVVITDPADEAPEIFWSFYAGLPARRITNAPDARMEKLNGSLHEMRHLIQVSDKSGGHYYREIDADLFARSVLRGQLPGLKVDPAKHLRQGLFARYAALLVSGRTHSIAPAIEACEAKRAFPDAKFLDAALGEICGRIAGKETGKYPERRDDESFQERCMDEPEVVYSLLRRCVEDGAFSRNPLADHIANRVLEAVEYFSGGLTRNPAVVNKIYPARQGLAA